MPTRRPTIMKSRTRVTLSLSLESSSTTILSLRLVMSPSLTRAELHNHANHDPMFVGAVAAKMVRGELQLLVRWEAGDNHIRHTIAVFGMTVHTGVQVIALGKHTKANGLSAHMQTCLLTPSPQMLASPFGRPIANHVPESWCPLMLGCMPYNLERFQKFMTCWI